MTHTSRFGLSDQVQIAVQRAEPLSIIEQLGNAGWSVTISYDESSVWFASIEAFDLRYFSARATTLEEALEKVQSQLEGEKNVKS